MAATCRFCQKEIPEASNYCPHCGQAQAGPPRKLFRSSANGKLLGVCSGFAEYWELDPTVMRAIYLGLTLFSGILPGIVLYFLLALIMPRR